MAKKDTNKYSKNANINPESHLSSILAILRMALMLIGIFGITFELFRENGWLSKLLGGIIDSTANMLLVVVALLGLWLLNRMLSSPNKSEAKKIGDMPMYAMMAVGLFYIYRIFTSGGF
jgi:membrane protein insertase Oxa1/YidC/SpoIIIJ